MIKSVNDVYKAIAKDFDATRFSLWSGVREFLDSLPGNTLMADIGCGNGKYLSYRKDIIVHGCDMCESLAYIAASKHNTNPNNNGAKTANVLITNALTLPYRDKLFDNTICIAVLHHMSCRDDRIRLLQELARITAKAGKIMISVWATEQDDPRMATKWKHLGNNDYMVPYMTTTRKETHDRYYHLFEKNEVIELCEKSHLHIERIWYEKNNWYIIAVPQSK